MVGQSESDDIFVSGVKTNELMITRLSVLPFLFQWENKNVYLVGSLIFGIQKVGNPQVGIANVDRVGRWVGKGGGLGPPLVAQ